MNLKGAQHCSGGSVFEPAPIGYPAGTLHEMRIQGAVTRWWQYGDSAGDPLVLVHGFRGDHHGLELIAAGLSKYRVIIPDLPGFGRSENLPHTEHTLSSYACWLIDLIQGLGLVGQVHLVGHSFGSIICSYATNARPALVERLSLINPISEPALEGPQRLMSRLAEFYYDAAARLPARLGLRLLRSRLITRVSSEFMMKSQDRTLRAFINGQHLAYFGSFTSPDTVVQAYRASISHTAAEYVAGIVEPVQMIVAERDDLGTLATQRAMFAQLQNGRWDLIEQVGHLIHYETPLRAAELIADFHREQKK